MLSKVSRILTFKTSLYNNLLSIIIETGSYLEIKSQCFDHGLKEPEINQGSS